MFGHAVGDAIGVPVEFCNRSMLRQCPVTTMMGFGTYDVPAGTWSDDTSMSLCALHSLAKGNIDYYDIMDNFEKWYYDNEFTATGVMFDIGNTCAEAIRAYVKLQCRPQYCGSIDEMSNGNGSLMRIHPFVLYAYFNNTADTNDFIDMIKDASSLTHAHSCSVEGCLIYAYILKELLNNPVKESVYNGLEQAKHYVNDGNKYYNRLLNNDIGTYKNEHIKSSGYVVDTLEAAVWCLLTTESYKECVLKAVNLGGDTDTIAAIAGGLAGALYGLDSIPTEWIETLHNKELIENMCNRAYNNWEVK